MPPRSLSEICIRKCIKNLNYLNSVGDLAYDAVRPILLKITSADQLREIEVLSPQLQGEDAEIWQKLIAKDFPGWDKKNYHPKNPLSWHLVYRKYKQEQEAEMKAAEAKLVSAFATLEEKKQSNTSKIVDQRLLPKPPGRRAPRSGRGGGGGALGGSSFLKKARREAREHASRIMSTPTGALAVRPGQIKKAPEAMVNDYRIAAQKDIRIRVPRMSKPKRDLELEAREERLMAAKGRALNKTRADTVHLLSDDEVDDHDDAASDPDDFLDEETLHTRLDSDDLFDDEDAQATVSKTLARVPEKHSLSPPKNAALSPARKQELIAPPASHKPRTGLLSNAYRGTAERPHVRQATREPQNLSTLPSKQPPARYSPQAKPQPSPERKTEVRQMASHSAAPPASEASPPAARISPPASPKEGPVIHRKRKMPVDIFMPKKTQRH